jgi:hypothetical protein
MGFVEAVSCETFDFVEQCTSGISLEGLRLN